MTATTPACIICGKPATRRHCGPNVSRTCSWWFCDRHVNSGTWYERWVTTP